MNIPGYSHENFGSRNAPNTAEVGVSVFGRRKTENLVSTRTHRLNAPLFNLPGVVAGAARTWLPPGADELRPPDPPQKHNDYPDAIDKHDAAGAHATSCDGHARTPGSPAGRSG